LFLIRRRFRMVFRSDLVMRTSLFAWGVVGPLASPNCLRVDLKSPPAVTLRHARQGQSLAFQLGPCRFTLADAPRLALVAARAQAAASAGAGVRTGALQTRRDHHRSF